MTTIIAVRLDQPDLIFPLTERQLSPDKLPITPDGVIHDRGFPDCGGFAQPLATP